MKNKIKIMQLFFVAIFFASCYSKNINFRANDEKKFVKIDNVVINKTAKPFASASLGFLAGGTIGYFIPVLDSATNTKKIGNFGVTTLASSTSALFVYLFTTQNKVLYLNNGNIEKCLKKIIHVR